MPWYSTGTVAVTANSATVTGTGTAFSANARVGDAFRGPDGRWYEITNIASATVLSIRPNYQGTTASGQAYTIAPMQGYVKESADRLRQLVDQFGAQLAALQPWATSATPAAARTALGAAPLASPALTGNPTAPTPAADDSDTSIATTAHVKAAMALFGVGAQVQTSTVDLNNLVTPGLYSCGGTSPNMPISNYAMLVCVEAYVGDRVAQTATMVAGTRRWFRVSVGGINWSPWQELFHTGNILGTVSQASGVPTGAIIERGSNANGEYVRFADGTQICFVEITVAVSANTAQTIVPSSPWPASFSATPNLSIAAGFYSNKLGAGSLASVSSSNFNVRPTNFDLTAPTSNTAGTCTLRISGIGRWY